MAAPNPTTDPGDDTLAAYRALGLPFLERPTKPGAIGRLGHYEILSRLGEGGYGMVLKAFDEKLHRDVAIKVLSADFEPGSTPRARFIREARAAAVIRHENVVQIYAVEEEPNPYLVMEYIPGVTLQALVDKHGRLPPRDVALAGAHIARGLAAAHEKGLIHRDIKPCNILVEKSGDGYVSKIADFGLALSKADARLTQSGMVAGTPMYMSPEQARGEDLDPRTDLFSLGCVLYTALTGQPPFGEGNPMTVLHAIISSHPKPVREFAPDAPSWLSDIIGKLIAKKREHRYQTAKEVAKAFTDALENPPPDPAKAKTMPTRKAVLPSGEGAAAGGGRRWLLVLLLLAAAAAGGYAAYHFFLRPADPAPRSAGDPPADPKLPLPLPPPPGDAKGPPPVPPAVRTPVAAAVPPVPPADGPTFTNALGMSFVRVPAGKFWMGPGNAAREADIPRPYYVGTHEVTQGQWEAVLGADKNPSQFSLRTDGQHPPERKVAETIPPAELKRLPVEFATWEECQTFVAALNAKLQEPGWTYRLPTSEEWECACCGGPGRPKDHYAFGYYLDKPGNELPAGKANFKDGGRGRPAPVGSYPPNALGLYDLHGNVAEYVHGTDINEKGERMAYFHGGMWADPAGHCVPHAVGSQVATATFRGAGLRLVRVAADAPPPPTVATVADLWVWPGYRWGPAERLGPDVNTPDRELSAALTADQRQLVFVRGKRLFQASRPDADAAFETAVPVLPTFDGLVDDSPTLTADGLVLAFPVKQKGAEHIWIARRKSVDDPFSGAEQVKAPVSVSETSVERAPVLSADGRTLFATVNGKIGLFTRGRDEAWTAGEALPEYVNPPDTFNVAVWVSADGRVLVTTALAGQRRDLRYFVRPAAGAPFGPGKELPMPPLPAGVTAVAIGRPWFSPGGRRVYFHVRENANDDASLDIWTARLELKK